MASAKALFFMSLRLFVVLFSLQFISLAFYKWDAFSFYMHFKDFLPDLSLAFILWIVQSVVFTIILWTIIFLLKILSSRMKLIRVEHLAAFSTLIIAPIFIKKFIFNFIALSSLIGSNQIVRLTAGLFLLGIIIWVVSKYAEKILYEIDARIKPVFWLFVILLIIAGPFSLFGNGHSEDGSLINNEPRGLSDSERPNIILVSMDALTARNMQVYNYERPTTPFIKEWAKDAMVFNRAYSSSNWTTPAAMSLMTGQRPWTHKVWYHAINQPVKNYTNNLPSILKDNGYYVYGFVQNFYAHPDTLGIGKAFEVKDESDTFWISPTWAVDRAVQFYVNRPVVAEWVFVNNPLLKYLNINMFHFPIYITSILSETVYDSFLEKISENQKHPFFAWVHVYPPHILYLPPEPYMGMFGDEEKYDTAEEQLNSNLIDTSYKAERQNDVDILKKRYDEFILNSDQQFKLFLKNLDNTIDMSNTIIILTSDHGESFSNGFVGHGHFDLYEPLIHVPLLVKTPWESKGQTIDMPVEQIDIAPTILELAGIPVPEWMEGRSLKLLFEGKEIEQTPVFSMQLINNRVIGNSPISKGTVAVMEGDYKLIYYLEKEELFLFNVQSDPDETNNLVLERPEMVHHLKKLIDDNISWANEGSKIFAWKGLSRQKF